MSALLTHVSLADSGVPPLLAVGRRRQSDVGPAGWSARRHVDAMEVCYVASGRQRVTLDGQTLTLGGNDVLVNYPGDWHELAGSTAERCHIYYVSFTLPARGPFALAAAGEADALRAALRALPRHFAGETRLKPSFDRTLRAAQAVKSAGDGVCRTVLLHAVQGLLLSVLACAARVGRPVRSRPVRAAVAYVRGHLHEPLDVADLARRVGLSVSHFHLTFKRQTGVPPREYVLREKTAAAARMLAAGGGVTRVSQALGFSSSQYFATVFRRYAGKTPTAFAAGEGPSTAGPAVTRRRGDRV